MRQMLGRWLAAYLGAPGHSSPIGLPTDLRLLGAVLRAGDVLLVEGTSRISAAIKYLTQSTWSHAGLYVGPLAPPSTGAPAACVIEADLRDGVRATPLSAFAHLHCRICRPVGLDADELRRICRFAIERLGESYDLKHVLDMARYLLPAAPVPLHWRRHLIALGSADPTRAICSTLIAEAFQSVGYPILPRIEQQHRSDSETQACVRQILHVRDHNLFTPRDFDVSPYFNVIKPELEPGLDHRALIWSDAPAPAAAVD